MSRLPRPDQYQSAVQNPRIAFEDPDLKAAQVECSPLGLPIVASGGFALTYRLRAPTGVWAVRCFHKSAPDLQERYAAISRFLSLHPNRYFIQAAYLPTGIRVGGEWFPITKMPWIVGDPLNLYVERNLQRPAVLAPLASKFAALIRQLEILGIAHGDLQHGNILVTNEELKLVDYDGMFVQDLAGRPSRELGHVNYQHPQRSPSDFDAHLDRFSAIVIYLALVAVTLKPDLWTTYASGENLLFQQKDFLDPSGSPLLRELATIPQLAQRVADFQVICRSELADVPRLEDFVARRYRPQGVVSGITTPLTRRRQYEVIAADRVGTLREKRGERVEVVGRIEDIRDGTTRYGNRRFVFLNFGDWHRSFSLVLWSEALALFKEMGIDPERYVGQWVSVTGVLDSYRAKPQMAITMPSEIEILDGEAAARERLSLGRAELLVPQPTSLRTAPDQSLVMGPSRPAASSRPSSPPRPKPQSSWERERTLSNLYRNFQATPQASSPGATPPATASPASSQGVTPPAPPQQPPAPSRGLKSFLRALLKWRG